MSTDPIPPARTIGEETAVITTCLIAMAVEANLKNRHAVTAPWSRGRARRARGGLVRTDVADIVSQVRSAMWEPAYRPVRAV
jgi:hypothetical protein